MIKNAEEFILLRTSEDPQDYLRAANEEAETSTWLEIVSGFPEMCFWVAQNKTVPLEILEILANSPESRVRLMVAMKNRLSEDLIATLAKDGDPTVRQRIAYNKKTPREVLELLARDLEPLVSDVASKRLGH